ncbi:polyubiquitin-like [Thalictrum thalictroides]|uniref:Polyubiquitin-like n=1 Tax=Thalictrum thalictroides TaxID=46969 RepID=A0A7J6UTR4_THATH|nr:polyubiquitin-like [Thalictrum thalictroides]
MKITIVTEEGSKYQITVSDSTTIFEVKEKIESSFSIPAFRQKLFLNWLELEDENDIQTYEIVEGMSIYLECDKPYKYCIVVKNSTEEFQIEIENTTTVRELKNLIQTDAGIPSEGMKLTYLNIELNDDTTLFGSNIFEDCEVEIDITP